MENTTQTDFRALCTELLEALEIQLDELASTNRLCKRARAALAQPEPVGLTDGTRTWLPADAPARFDRPAITPIPVSERLPGAEDCDEEGRCWYFSYETVIGGANWQLFTEEEQEGFVPPTHWLPTTALPLPEGGAA